jgi:ATP synthase protein I
VEATEDGAREPEAKPGEAKEPSPSNAERFLAEVKAKTDRRAREADYRDRGFWTGVGVMGLVGWSVILPAVAGAYAGILLDRALELDRIFSGLLAMAGLGLGCWNAWRMVRKVLRSHGEEETEAGEKGE